MASMNSDWLTAPSSARRMAGLSKGGCSSFRRRVATAPVGSSSRTVIARSARSGASRSAVGLRPPVDLAALQRAHGGRAVGDHDPLHTLEARDLGAGGALRHAVRARHVAVEAGIHHARARHPLAGDVAIRAAAEHLGHRRERVGGGQALGHDRADRGRRLGQRVGQQRERRAEPEARWCGRRARTARRWRPSAPARTGRGHPSGVCSPRSPAPAPAWRRGSAAPRAAAASSAARPRRWRSPRASAAAPGSSRPVPNSVSKHSSPWSRVW